MKKNKQATLCIELISIFIEALPFYDLFCSLHPIWQKLFSDAAWTRFDLLLLLWKCHTCVYLQKKRLSVITTYDEALRSTMQWIRSVCKAHILLEKSIVSYFDEFNLSLLILGPQRKLQPKDTSAYSGRISVPNLETISWNWRSGVLGWSDVDSWYSWLNWKGKEIKKEDSFQEFLFLIRQGWQFKKSLQL